MAMMERTHFWADKPLWLEMVAFVASALVGTAFFVGLWFALGWLMFWSWA